MRRDHTSFCWRGRRVRLPLVGDFHVQNALAAATAAGVLGVPDDEVVAGLERAETVPGRFEVVTGDAPFTVVVDYAHTPDALRHALAAARALAEGKVLVVFGCGGDRDRAKRPVMGEVAAAGADVVVLTSDNPRSEDPTSIIDDVAAGIPAGTAVTVEPDRAAAITVALQTARPGDVVVVAGKGHEQAIEAGGHRLPFDDRRQAAAAMERLARRARP